MSENSGDVEVQVTSFTLLNRADTDLPFMPLDSHNLVCARSSSVVRTIH